MHTLWVDEENNHPKPNESQILAALSQTGFLLEQRVFQSFQARGLDVEANVAYADPETGKSREVDILATWSHSIGDSHMYWPQLYAEIFAECKNTQNPFAVVGRSTTEWFASHTYHAEFDPLELEFGQHGADTYDTLNFAQLPHHPAEDGFVGSQLIRMNLQGGKWKANNDGVFDGIMFPLAKAQVWRDGECWIDTERVENLSSPSFNFIFPILVTTGPVFTVTVDGPSAHVKEVAWAPVIRELQQEGLDGSFFLEVVRFDKMDEYLDRRFFGYLEEVEKALVRNSRYFDPQWLLQNLGKPAKRALFDAWVANRKIS